MKKILFYLGLINLLFFIAGCEKNYNFNDLGMSGGGTDRYNEIIENPFVNTFEQNISTFSVDVDGGSFSNCRKIIENGIMPPIAAIRTEEFINYFQYNYGEPDDGLPFYHNSEIAACPWNAEHKILRIGFKGKTFTNTARKGTNFIFLIDVSGSMSSDDKLGLIKECLVDFVNAKIDYRDKIAIVTYAGSTEIALKPTSGSDKDKIISKINSLKSGGSTAGADGINTAYKLAEENFITGGNNRIVLATDGDFNVGISSQDDLIKLIEEKRDLGVFISVLGVGSGNLNEGMMEQLADHGNGNYEYIDNIEEGHKVFINEFNSFYPVAKDVKIQVEFDSLVVASYRLIGYENRKLENQDFTNDSTDAGDIGSDQDVTALYELIMKPGILNNQKSLNVSVAYKLPTETTSKYFSLDVFNSEKTFEQASENFRFACGIAAFALVLRNSEYVGQTNYNDIISWIQNASSYNPNNYKTDLLTLINKAKTLPARDTSSNY